MFASTNVFTASALFGETPSVCTLTNAPLITSDADACPVTFPAVPDTNETVHCPDPFVFTPAVVHDPVAVPWFAPFESVSVTVTCSPAAATNVPEPVSFDNVTVNVCD